jgi:hypothetical protein
MTRYRRLTSRGYIGLTPSSHSGGDRGFRCVEIRGACSGSCPELRIGPSRERSVYHSRLPQSTPRDNHESHRGVSALPAPDLRFLKQRSDLRTMGVHERHEGEGRPHAAPARVQGVG